MSNKKAILLLVVGVLGGGLSVAVSPSLVTGVAAVMSVAAAVGLFLCAGAGRRDAERQVDAIQKDCDHINKQLAAAQMRAGDLNLRVQLLQQRKHSTEAILDSIRDAVLVTDEQDRVVLANAAAETLFAFAFAPNTLTPVMEVCGDKALAALIQKSRTGRIAHVRHEIAFVRDDKTVAYEAVLSCTQDEGRVSAVVTVLHDVTREKEIAQMKNDFVSHVSHELKTPLASINAYAEMLVDGEAQDEQTLHEFCGVIQGQAQRLTRLIEEILNVSRIESGLIKVQKAPHSMALVIRDAVEMIKSYAQEKNIAVNAPAPILYDQALIDRDMLSQVVINLLSNAVKYTPAGGSIDVAVEVNDADNRITVTVSDSGVGIPPEDVEHVFDKFYRVQANNKMAKGTGLGLNLVKQIVETVHGGRVFVSSTVGQGSVFGFDLPLAGETAEC